MSNRKKSLLSFLEEETNSKKDSKKEKENITNTTNATSKFNIPFSLILKELESYKEDFKLSDYYNVRLTSENYEQLKYLKITNVSMMHLVNFLVKIVVETDDYQQFINKKNEK